MPNETLISVVLPVCNEEGNLPPLYDRLTSALEGLGVDYELVFVDDGSRDDSARIIRELHGRDPRVKALFFSRNFGHERALTAGIDVARGDAVVLMDADLQDPPEVIPKLAAKWREGYDVVGAQRARRAGETWLKRASAYAFYRLMRKLAPWEMPADTGNFCLIDRRVAAAFRQCREWNRFVRVLVSWTGYRQASVPFDRPPRQSGASKYGVIRQLGLAATSILSFSLMPLRIITTAGAVVALLAAVALGVAGAAWIAGAAVSGVALLGASLWFLGGVQCLALGVVGEYVGRVLMETQHRPLYFVRESLGFSPAIDDGNLQLLGDRASER